jgi:hypothetical protein
MIRVRFDPATLTGNQRTEWDAWLAEARAATGRVIDAFEQWKPTKPSEKFTYEWEDEIWGWLKEFLLTHVLHDKCAYCETRDVRSAYHAEHFRPKGMVRYRPTNAKKLHKAMTASHAGLQIEHPGYFWLAYDWKNLLPSCGYCNAFHGKNNQFPTAVNHYVLTQAVDAATIAQLKDAPLESPTYKGMYYLLTEDLNALEAPQLVNPLFEDPRSVIRFGDLGMVTAVNDDPRGQRSIEVYDLAKEKLRQARQIAQEDGENRFLIAKMNARQASIAARKAAGLAAIKPIIDGHEPYSAAILDYLKIVPNPAVD